MQSHVGIKNFLYHIGLGNLCEKAHFSDVGILSIIRQRLEDLELQRWFSEIIMSYGKIQIKATKCEPTVNSKQEIITDARITFTRSPTSGTETSLRNCDLIITDWQ